MNLITLAPLWLVVFLGVTIIAAAIEDGIRLRISNITSLAVLAGAFFAAIVEGPSWSLWQNVVVFVALLILGTVAFSAGWLGGGDVKLFAATGLWCDLQAGLSLVALVFVAGGVVAVGFLLSRPFRRVQGSIRNRSVPYGIAIAVGTLALIGLDARALGHEERPLPPIKVIPHRP